MQSGTEGAGGKVGKPAPKAPGELIIRRRRRRENEKSAPKAPGMFWTLTPKSGGSGQIRVLRRKRLGPRGNRKCPRHARAMPSQKMPIARAMPAPRPRHCPVPPGPQCPGCPLGLLLFCRPGKVCPLGLFFLGARTLRAWASPRKPNLRPALLLLRVAPMRREPQRVAGAGGLRRIPRSAVATTLVSRPSWRPPVPAHVCSARVPKSPKDVEGDRHVTNSQRWRNNAPRARGGDRGVWGAALARLGQVSEASDSSPSAASSARAGGESGAAAPAPERPAGGCPSSSSPPPNMRADCARFSRRKRTDSLKRYTICDTGPSPQICRMACTNSARSIFPLLSAS
eukprot:gene5069-biopygen17615